MAPITMHCYKLELNKRSLYLRRQIAITARLLIVTSGHSKSPQATNLSKSHTFKTSSHQSPQNSATTIILRKQKGRTPYRCDLNPII